ncbi:MAG: Regulatory protein RecX [Steroidobacteraceae bacterium]|nr:Regulatory protein RecX [Steroidobacteraceae bacterium]
MRSAAVALLARRDYASGELKAKLADKGHDPAEIDAVVADFEAQRLVDDARYAGRFVAHRAARGQGPVRIRIDLKALGLAPDLIEAALAREADFPRLAAAARARKFGPKPPATLREKARQSRFLQYRGFSADDIRSALGNDPEGTFDPDP